MNLKTLLLAFAALVLTSASILMDVTQSARRVRGPAPLVPLSNEPLPKLIVDPPLSDQLAHGRVVIQYRAENMRIVPVFGSQALDISPRVGHIHVTVDDLPWHWADASGEPIILVGFKPGKHKVLIELADPTHRVVDKGVAEFVIAKSVGHAGGH
jgi:hypothetical protein